MGETAHIAHPLLTGITVALVAAIIANHRHHVLKVLANIAWRFVVSAFVAIRASISVVGRHRSRSTRAA